MDELYRGYRISVKQAERWTARVTHVRGTLMPLDAHASLVEGPQICCGRARAMIDRYIAFLSQNGLDGEPSQLPD